MKRMCNMRKLREVEGHPNQYLKDVAVFGFLGQEADAEIVTYLLKSAFMLEEIAIEPARQLPKTRQKIVINVARKLVEVFCPRAKLILFD